MFYNSIIKPVLESIKKFPDRNAFCIDGKFYSYAEFEKQASKIQVAIKENPNVNNNVGLVINDDLETYASILALWLNGHSYVPLHPHWPMERCMEIIDQVEMDLILDSSVNTRYEGMRVINTSGLTNSSPYLVYRKDISNDDLAYILFTSGSTGKPKGVQITRDNIAAFMDSFWETGIVLDEHDRCLQAFDLTFDVSVQSLLVPLLKGACCYTIPYGQIKYIYVSKLFNEHKLTFAAMAPSMLRYLRPFFGSFDATSMRQCILTAEACPLDLMEDWFKAAPNVELYDFYGPTECTIYCTYYKLARDGHNKSLNGIISIGKPLANCIGLIIDEAGNELASEEKGELCIAGRQVTKGYWKNKEKNENSFFLKEVDGKSMRFYHTGDLCYKDEDGDIMYSGRLDHQAKIQGFRVEMGEIEYHAREFLGGINVVCLPYDNKNGLTEIAMFIEAKPMATEKLKEYMRTKMPGYMIPSQIIFQKEFVLNNNGKIDKKLLKESIVL